MKSSLFWERFRISNLGPELSFLFCVCVCVCFGCRFLLPRPACVVPPGAWGVMGGGRVLSEVPALVWQGGPEVPCDPAAMLSSWVARGWRC